MYLEEVNIEGFKSFSLPTSMGFQPGIGVIMGNNGVGKSNILDAIVWALGEDRLEKIRCYETEELFFSGSNNTPPADTVSVELIFREGEEKNAPKLKLLRKLSKYGGSLFEIGGIRLDRDQYMEKLSSYDLVHCLKTIIRQEEINSLIQQDPADRFSTLMDLLELSSAQELENLLHEKVEPVFLRYMEYLIPLADVKLITPSKGGRPTLDVEVNLSGNRKRLAHQLSGGEKAITSLALLLSVFGFLKSPLYLLDEVEPALDYTNHKSMQQFLRDVGRNRQMIMITHLRSTIELADTLHGVRTRFDGSSFMKFYFVMDERLLRLYKCC